MSYIQQLILLSLWSARMNDFARLVEVEIPRLRRYARALHRWDVSTADDLVQDTLVRAVAKQHLWQPGTNLRAWLFTVMHNQYVNHVRRAAREGTTVDIDDVHNVLVSPSDPTVSLLLRDLSRGLARLQVEQRQTILLIGLEGMSYEEVAQILCIPIGTVRSRLSRGRLQLRQIMGVDAAADTAPALPLAMAA
jgi:RNA polymerase sigma-70 factor (ECF subfamily)